MIFTKIKRIIRSGFVNFWRNGLLSFAAIVVITLSLCAFAGIIFAGAFGRALISDVKDKVDIKAKCSGGGKAGQAGALRLGIARGLCKLDPENRIALAKAGHMTRDPREVERKKYGRSGARKRFQFSKR